MIAQLSGMVVVIAPHSLVIDVAGVGYKIFATRATLASLTEGGTATLITYLVVREDALDLYGFLSENEKRMFELLLTVSGVGPKSALSMLSFAGIDTLVSAIAANKASHLTAIAGIGKKTAAKVVLELKDKVSDFDVTRTAHAGDAGTIEALRALGYSAEEARDALHEVPENILGESARLRETLRILGGK